MSPQSHPESAFFKPKLPGDRNMVQTAASGHRGANMHGQKTPLSTKAANTNAATNEQLQIWAGKKKPEAREDPARAKAQQQLQI